MSSDNMDQPLEPEADQHIEITGPGWRRRFHRLEVAWRSIEILINGESISRDHIAWVEVHHDGRGRVAFWPVDRAGGRRTDQWGNPLQEIRTGQVAVRVPIAWWLMTHQELHDTQRRMEAAREAIEQAVREQLR